MRARYDDTCHVCGRVIVTGQTIATIRGEWVHASCAEARWDE